MHLNMTEDQWREVFEPRPSPFGDGNDLILEVTDPRSEPHVAGLPTEFVWTEYVDYSFDDDDHSLIVNGYISSAERQHDLLGWYVCAGDWTAAVQKEGEIFVTVEW